MIPGEYILKSESILCNKGKDTRVIKVINKGDRPIQVGSHFHFYEVNAALSFEREQAYGMHLNIAAGTSIRFEPGDAKEVKVVPFSGERKIYGLNNKIEGALQ